MGVREVSGARGETQPSKYVLKQMVRFLGLLVRKETRVPATVGDLREIMVFLSSNWAFWAEYKTLIKHMFLSLLNSFS